jgi:hypothetical protein
LSKHAIEPVPVHQVNEGFYSTYFLVTKKDGGFRPILNLKFVNRLMVVPTFKMETVRMVLDQDRKDEWLTSMDLKDAYLHVPLHRSFRKYTRFCFDGVCYQFRVLPFGISTAPRVFTKVMLVAAQLVRKRGIHCHPYLDDWLIRTASPRESTTSTTVVMDVLTRLGWIINLKKSDLVPSQDQVFLGVRFQTALAWVSLSPSRVISVGRSVKAFQRQRRPTARFYMKLLGHMTSAGEVMFRARLMTRPFQMALSRQWNNTQDMNLRLMIPRWLYPHIQWWIQVENLTRVARSRPTPPSSDGAGSWGRKPSEANGHRRKKLSCTSTC